MGALTYGTDSIPNRLSIAMVDLWQGTPLKGVVVAASADVAVQSATGSNAQFSMSLGILGSDHVGYVAFDLSGLGRRLAAIQAQIPAGAIIQVTSLWVFPNGQIGPGVDALSAPVSLSDVLFIRVGVDPGAVALVESSVSLPAMQSPGLSDWYLSPASFTNVPAQ